MTELSLEDPGDAALTVSQLNRRVKALLEQGIARLRVEGEISNLARPASGHVYFSLKDDQAQVRAAWFRQRQRGPSLKLRDGDQVVVLGRVSLYEVRGEYQLIVDEIEPAGEGLLKREFERLKRKLDAEGLFDPARKRPLPRLPGRIGVITSPTGAALRDILSVLGRRFPAVPVIVYPASVQGAAAPGELRQALGDALRRNECDVLIVARGGGSLEDLWAFNDESLARAIAASTIPTVSAVGHEIDFTIADFVADLRAPTPSGAAELVVPDRSDWLKSVDALALRIARLGQRQVEERAQTLDWLGRRLAAASPAMRLARQQDRLREMRGRLAAAMREHRWRKSRRLDAAHSGLLRASPARSIERRLARLSALAGRLRIAERDVRAGTRHRLELLERRLESLDPKAVLKRGYAVVTAAASGKALTDASAVARGDALSIELYRGRLAATVKDVADDDA